MGIQISLVWSFHSTSKYHTYLIITQIIVCKLKKEKKKKPWEKEKDLEKKRKNLPGKQTSRQTKT